MGIVTTTNHYFLFLPFPLFCFVLSTQNGTHQEFGEQLELSFREPKRPGDWKDYGFVVVVVVSIASDA